ncbi:hypothetical protein ARMGADRAFT_1037256 [Armillaria gallica]|uniref:Uncharacterized protein n=1 Tax=Armillaria gallica TaxID=47427 RepID=A0A2H3CMT7_ARMGA|nr:hypothetical protein ARMGADRAFT_1037256 [Armillaria gallica]
MRLWKASSQQVDMARRPSIIAIPWCRPATKLKPSMVWVVTVPINCIYGNTGCALYLYHGGYVWWVQIWVHTLKYGYGENSGGPFNGIESFAVVMKLSMYGQWYGFGISHTVLAHILSGSQDFIQHLYEPSHNSINMGTVQIPKSDYQAMSNDWAMNVNRSHHVRYPSQGHKNQNILFDFNC